MYYIYIYIYIYNIHVTFRDKHWVVRATFRVSHRNLFRKYNLNYTPTTFGGNKVEEKLHLGVCEQESLNTTALDNWSDGSSSDFPSLSPVETCSLICRGKKTYSYGLSTPSSNLFSYHLRMMCICPLVSERGIQLFPYKRRSAHEVNADQMDDDLY
jgi:hypothetical protein